MQEGVNFGPFCSLPDKVCIHAAGMLWDSCCFLAGEPGEFGWFGFESSGETPCTQELISALNSLKLSTVCQA